MLSHPTPPHPIPICGPVKGPSAQTSLPSGTVILFQNPLGPKPKVPKATPAGTNISPKQIPTDRLTLKRHFSVAHRPHRIREWPTSRTLPCNSHWLSPSSTSFSLPDSMPSLPGGCEPAGVFALGSLNHQA